MIITVLDVLCWYQISMNLSGFWFVSFNAACVCERMRDWFDPGRRGIFFSVPDMLLQTWFLLLFCEAVVHIKL